MNTDKWNENKSIYAQRGFLKYPSTHSVDPDQVENYAEEENQKTHTHTQFLFFFSLSFALFYFLFYHNINDSIYFSDVLLRVYIRISLSVFAFRVLAGSQFVM